MIIPSSTQPRSATKLVGAALPFTSPSQKLRELLSKLPEEYQKQWFHASSKDAQRKVVSVWWRDKPIVATYDSETKDIILKTMTLLSRYVVLANAWNLVPLQDSQLQLSLMSLKAYLDDLRQRMTEGLYTYGYNECYTMAILDEDTWVAYCRDIAFVYML